MFLTITVYVLDISERPVKGYLAAQNPGSPLNGSLQYSKADVTDVQVVDETISSTTNTHCRFNGLIGAAGIQNIGQAIGQLQ